MKPPRNRLKRKMLEVVTEFERAAVLRLEELRAKDVSIDIIDVLAEFFEENESIDPASLLFSDEFKNFVAEAAMNRKMMRRDPKLSTREDLEELEI